MSLSAREQRTLSRIADQIAVSDPELAGSLAVFNELTHGEEMPEGSHAGGSPQRKAGRRRRRRGHGWKRLRQRPTSSPAWHILAALIFIIAPLITAALVLSHTGH